MSTPLVCARPDCGHDRDLHDGICFDSACECVRFVEPTAPEPRTLDVVEDELTGVSLSLYEEELLTERLRLALSAAKRGRSQLRAQVAEFDALGLGAVDGRVSAACGDPAHPTWLRKPDDLRACPWCRIAELEHTVQQMVEGLNGHDCPPPNEAPLDTVTRWMGYLGAAEARVAELEAERRETNEALDDAVRELRARQSCPCPPEGRPHQVGCPQAEVPSPLFPTVASLREASSREEPHDSPLHHPYRVGHDLPETGGGSR